jgi:hypothetical protein
MSWRLAVRKPTGGRLSLLSGGSILATVAPALAIIGLAWALPACCCGGGGGRSIIPGPPGTISGNLILPPPGSPQAAAVYAFSLVARQEVVDATRYTMTRVEPPNSTYSLTVPPGYYFVIARFDSDLLQFGGHTEHVRDKLRNSNLSEIRVNAQQHVGGIDIGDWGTADSRERGWWIDVYGLPLIDASQPSPSVTAAPFRQFPVGQDPVLSGKYAGAFFGGRVAFTLPIGWREVEAPSRSISSYSAFYANESVASPINLDDNGVWLTIEKGGYACPIPDSRFVVATTSVTMIDGSETFYFEDPPAKLGPQPFAGYTMLGGAVHTGGQSCIQFIFKAVTRPAMESNLAILISFLHSVRFPG